MTTDWEPSLSPRQEWRLHNGEGDVPEWFMRFCDRIRQAGDAQRLSDIAWLEERAQELGWMLNSEIRNGNKMLDRQQVLDLLASRKEEITN